MLFFRLTTKTYLSPQQLVYMHLDVPFMTLPVHVHTVIPINRLDLPVKVSTALHVNRYTCSSVYLSSLFLHFGITCTVTFPLICWGMYTQILMLLLCLRTNTYLSPQLLVYLPLNVPDHDPAISFSYFKCYILVTAKTYPSTFCCSTCPQIYPFMSIPVQYFSLFGITYTVKFPLICWVHTHRSNRK